MDSDSDSDSSATAYWRGKQLREKIAAEYVDRIFTSDIVLQKVYNRSLSASDFEPVIQDCIRKFRVVSESIDLSENDRRDPFLYRLNAVKDSLKEHGLMEKSIYANVRFEKCEEDIVGGISSDTVLRPALLARVPSRETPKWEDVELCVEMDDSYTEMIVQGGVYVKCMTRARNQRFLAMIYYQPNTTRVSFGLFSAAWLCTTRTPYNISTEEGQRGFIADMAKIWSCTERWDAGYDTTIENGEVELGGYGKFTYAKRLHTSNSLGGRRTRVDRIVAVESTDESTSTGMFLHLLLSDPQLIYILYVSATTITTTGDGCRYDDLLESLINSNNNTFDFINNRMLEFLNAHYTQILRLCDGWRKPSPFLPPSPLLFFGHSRLVVKLA
ncbi:hypothetical protein Clacol_007163 [Clathrus columnatus]|uniref:Uncharacterized protein n=1 Tax=Clathrus columnatus TaxID=1419009 RepID=A0AAV5AE57_9AGAM|nr:hypothetical protein Clacol_007163 [Clathrus columnatus]